MRNALAIFEGTINEARHLTALYEYLSGQIAVPYPFEDLLRAQVVYVIGAFDKLMHDIIRIGMCETYVGWRSPTGRYRAEPIPLELHATLIAATVPPPQHIFELEVVKKLRWLSFQRPDPIAEGLSLIWDEKHKWTAIAGAMTSDPQSVRTKLLLYATRRNAIVHESDMDPMTNAKTPLRTAEVTEITDFIEACGRAIVGLVA